MDITNEEQRQWIAKVMQSVSPGHSLIPKERTYKKNLSHYQVQIKNMGLSKCHGLRHAYAQRLYVELTKGFDVTGKGLTCPINGGTSSKNLRGHEREWDKSAREIISRQLGHARLAITNTYLGC